MHSIRHLISHRPATAFPALILILFLGCCVQSRSQVSDPVSPIPDYVRQAAEQRAKNNPSFNELMKKVGLGAVPPGFRRRKGMSAADRKRLKALMTPEPALVEKYREFLEQDDTGILRLYPDFDCVSKGTINVAGDCANQVHNGSEHNFRGSSYFSDIRYNNGNLTGAGFFSHEILADIGDVPLEQVTLASRGVDFLNSIVPAEEFRSANDQFRQIVAGTHANGIRYSRSVAPRLDRTYAIRIVAFDNKDSLTNRMLRRKPDPLSWYFRSVQADKRTDIIVAFRVVSIEKDGNITLLWKRLSTKKAPVISFGKKEPLKSFK